MELSILIARIAAVTYLASGAALLIGTLDLQKTYHELGKSNMFTALMGAFTTLLGMLIVNHHNFWVKEWYVLITIIGWVLLIEGIFYIVYPKALLSLFKKMPQSQVGWGVFTLLAGLFFGYFGFMA